MAKRFLMATAALISLVVALFLIYSYSMANEPEPRKSAVERMVGASDLKEFGVIEGSFLDTPNNYGFYDANEIYVVERSLGDSETYNDKYVVIEAGEEPTEQDRIAIRNLEKNMAALGLPDKYAFDSKHRIRVYAAGEMVQEEWMYKALIEVDGKMYLSFMPAGADGSGKGNFNLFEEGYIHFRDF